MDSCAPTTRLASSPNVSLANDTMCSRLSPSLQLPPTRGGRTFPSPLTGEGQGKGEPSASRIAAEARSEISWRKGSTEGAWPPLLGLRYS